MVRVHRHQRSVSSRFRSTESRHGCNRPGNSQRRECVRCHHPRVSTFRCLLPCGRVRSPRGIRADHRPWRRRRRGSLRHTRARRIGSPDSPSAYRDRSSSSAQTGTTTRSSSSAIGPFGSSTRWPTRSPLASIQANPGRPGRHACWARLRTPPSRNKTSWTRSPIPRASRAPVPARTQPTRRRTSSVRWLRRS